MIIFYSILKFSLISFSFGKDEIQKKNAVSCRRDTVLFIMFVQKIV